MPEKPKEEATGLHAYKEMLKKRLLGLIKTPDDKRKVLDAAKQTVQGGSAKKVVDKKLAEMKKRDPSVFKGVGL